MYIHRSSLRIYVLVAESLRPRSAYISSNLGASSVPDVGCTTEVSKAAENDLVASCGVTILVGRYFEPVERSINSWFGRLHTKTEPALLRLGQAVQVLVLCGGEFCDNMTKRLLILYGTYLLEFHSWIGRPMKHN